MTSPSHSTQDIARSDRTEIGDEAPAVRLERVSVRFGETRVLDEVDLEIPAGDFLGIIGPNGAGKSVLLRTMLGLVEPTAGRVRVLGRPPSQVRGSVGYVPQFALFDRSFPISVIEVVLMGRLHRRPVLRRFSDSDRERAHESLQRAQMDQLADRQIGRLSGGELQRVLIARALAVESRILLLDEPTASLDPRGAHDLYDLMAELSQTMTIVLVSHDVGVMSEHVRRMICLNRRIVHDGAVGVTPEILGRTYGYDVTTVAHDHPLID